MRRRKAKDRLAGRHLATPKMYTFINLSPAILSLSLSIGPTLSRLINIFVSFFVSPLVFRLFFNKFDTKFKLRLCRNRPRTAQNEKKKCSQLFIPILAGRLCGTFETGQYIDILLHVVCCVFFLLFFFPILGNIDTLRVWRTDREAKRRWFIQPARPQRHKKHKAIGASRIEIYVCVRLSWDCISILS